jgi:hypothetical protein
VFYSCMLSRPPTKLCTTSSMYLMNRVIQCVTILRGISCQGIIINYFVNHIFLIFLVDADSGQNTCNV